MNKHEYQEALHHVLAEALGREPTLAEITRALNTFEKVMNEKKKPRPKP